MRLQSVQSSPKNRFLDEVKKNYLEVLEQIKITNRRILGWFCIPPYYFEFWQGSEFRQ